MSTSTIRTTTHSYPEEEINAMMHFYSGKRCIITRKTRPVDWSHMLDAASESSNERLAEMLSRNLRENRHPSHAAEVRENIVPIETSHHRDMNQPPPISTLFLHEDVLARTLTYEQDLHAWRITELEAGRVDPGRPTYDEVFGGERITQHRYHCATTYAPFSRIEGMSFAFYHAKDCPGNPTSQARFPIIDTLLSILFSLLHNFPRLAAISPFDTHQQQLIVMGSEIMRLWWWDPSPERIKRSREIRNQNVAASQYNNTPNPKPHPIHHLSRRSTTFSTKQPTITFGVHTTNSLSHKLNQGKYAVEPRLGPISLRTPTYLDWPRDGDEGLTKEDLQHLDDSITAGVIGSPMTSEVWTETEDSDNIINITAIQDKSTFRRSSLDIMSWSQKVVNSESEPLLTPTSFERGAIASMSVNDILMVKGLINPSVYLRFFDLSLFSCC